MPTMICPLCKVSVKITAHGKIARHGHSLKQGHRGLIQGGMLVPQCMTSGQKPLEVGKRIREVCNYYLSTLDRNDVEAREPLLALRSLSDSF